MLLLSCSGLLMVSVAEHASGGLYYTSREDPSRRGRKL